MDIAVSRGLAFFYYERDELHPLFIVDSILSSTRGTRAPWLGAPPFGGSAPPAYGLLRLAGVRPPAGNRGAPARGVDVKPPSPRPPGPGPGPGPRGPLPQGPGRPQDGDPGSRIRDLRGPRSPGSSGPGPGGPSGAPRGSPAPWRGVDVKPLRRRAPGAPKRAKKPEKRLFRVFPGKKAKNGPFC